MAKDEGAGPQGQRLFRSAWGWSMSSAADALDVAHEQLRKALATIRTGKREGPYYPRVPLREPILDELVIDGEQAYVITRNRYGAEVLNTDRVLIADIDLPELQTRPGGGLLRRLFRRSTAEEGPAPEPAPVLERLAMLENWARAYPELGVIVYRTASGLRVFVTGVGEPPSSARAEQILVDLGADPIYRELCRSHDTGPPHPQTVATPAHEGTAGPLAVPGGPGRAPVPALAHRVRSRRADLRGLPAARLSRFSTIHIGGTNHPTAR